MAEQKGSCYHMLRQRLIKSDYEGFNIMKSTGEDLMGLVFILYINCIML